MTGWKDIKAIVFDVDGIFTDGGIYAVDGDLLRRYDSRDGMATRIASMQGLGLGIITGGISNVIVQRMVRCGFKPEDIYLGSRRKIEEFDDYCMRHALSYDQVMYCGDDLPDIPVMKACGIGACPADAVEEVLAAADYISECNGGRRFVRDVVEKVLKSRDKWFLDDMQYKKTF